MQVLMSRTVNVDEEELLLATNDRATKMIKTTVTVRPASLNRTGRSAKLMLVPLRHRALLRP